MKESDWKIFTVIKDEALDQYCRSALLEFAGVIEDEDESAHDRYLRLYTGVKNTDRKMARLFNGHSRSKAWLQLLEIRREGLANDKLVATLSEEFRRETDPSELKW